MTCGNPIKYKIQNVYRNWLNVFLIKRLLNNDQMESLQFNILNFSDREVEKILFFHY